MRRTCLLIGLLATSACTQEPAKVVMRGGEVFARNIQSMASLSPAAGNAAPVVVAQQPVSAPQQVASASQSTASRVTLQSVSSSDLPPPSKAAPAAPQKTAEVAPAKAPEKKRANVAYIWPVEGKVISHFGAQGKGKANDGISIASASGEPVYAAADGEVVFVGDKLKGYGNMVMIKHKNGKTSTYAHMKHPEVARYTQVKQGDIIGYVGATGNVKEPQLYFAMHEGTKAVNPEQYLSSSYASLK